MDEKFSNIMISALGLFNKYGIHSISMDDLCRYMGISKKTLYCYVNSKSDLIRHMLEFQFNTVLELFQKVQNKKFNAIDTLLEFSKSLGQLLKDYKTNPTLEYDLMKYYPEIYKTHTEHRNKLMIKHLKDNIRQGMKEGYYRDDLNPEIIANLYITRMKDILSPDFFPEGKFSFRKIFNTMFENHIRGISNEAGIKYFETKCQNKCF
jgi:AcrR family transcriptional regulator